MQQIGGLLVLLGAGSFVLNMLNMEFRLLSWIDTWGPTVSLIIKIALIVVGAALWLAGNKASDGDEGQAQE
ncbi:MAG: hypothetical protein AAF351_01225 [Pseudomonadota bacterium]